MRQATKRPRIKLPFGMKDRLFAFFGMLVLLLHWGLVLTVFMTEEDTNGSKTDLLFLPFFATATYLLVTVLEKIPHQLNYLTDITEANAEKEYRKAVNMLRILEPVQSLLSNTFRKAKTMNCRLVWSFRSQFFQSLRHFSSHAKLLSTTHLLGNTVNLLISFRLAICTSTFSPRVFLTSLANGSPV